MPNSKDDSLNTSERRAGTENVNHPPHYQAGGLEVIDIIEAFELDFCLGNVVKYVLRAGRKATYGGFPDELRDAELEDLEKALWYLRRGLAMRSTETSESEVPAPTHQCINCARFYSITDPDELVMPLCGRDNCFGNLKPLHANVKPTAEPDTPEAK